jgi:ribosome-associated protein
VIVIARTIAKPRRAAATTENLLELINKILDDGKAEEIVSIDLRGKSSIADYMVIATGRSARQVAALSEHLLDAFKDNGYGRVPVEGLRHGDWVLIDVGDVLIHLFRPEVRSFYNLEKMWGASLPETAAAAS